MNKWHCRTWNMTCLRCFLCVCVSVVVLYDMTAENENLRKICNVKISQDCECAFVAGAAVKVSNKKKLILSNRASSRMVKIATS